MKRLAAFLTAVPLLVAVPAWSNQCPLLIKQLTDETAKLPATDPRLGKVKALIDEARKLHAEGSHTKSIAAADEAAKVLGITLKKN
jgi:hypothetical protein